MHSRKHLIAYLLSFAALLAVGVTVEAQQAHRAQPNSAANIQSDSIWFVGQVMDLDAQVPIANARVELEGYPCLRTNHEGKFFIRGVRGETRTVNVRAMGYEPHSINLTAENATEPADVWLIRASGNSKRGKVVKQLPRGKTHEKLQANAATSARAN
jgi:hypothetical protein